jgi:hypothetical protein
MGLDAPSFGIDRARVTGSLANTPGLDAKRVTGDRVTIRLRDRCHLATKPLAANNRE